MNSQTMPDVLEWIRFLFTIITPFAILWLGIAAETRRRIIDRIHFEMNEGRKEINEKISDTRKEVAEGRAECREDIQAIIRQLSEYPRRNELQEAIRDVKHDLRPIPSPRQPQR